MSEVRALFEVGCERWTWFYLYNSWRCGVKVLANLAIYDAAMVAKNLAKRSSRTVELSTGDIANKAIAACR